MPKNSRAKSWQTTKFTINFHPLEHSDWIELYFKIQVPYLLTVGNRGLVRVLEKKTEFRNFLSSSNALWDGLGLGFECSGLVNITGPDRSTFSHAMATNGFGRDIVI